MLITRCPTVTLQLHNSDLFRTCRTSSFCTVAWQLARFQLTDALLGPSAIAELLVIGWCMCVYCKTSCRTSLCHCTLSSSCRRWHTAAEQSQFLLMFLLLILIDLDLQYGLFLVGIWEHVFVVLTVLGLHVIFGCIAFVCSCWGLPYIPVPLHTVAKH